MKRNLFFAYTLLVILNVFAQTDTDATTNLVDTQKEVVKADGDSAFMKNDYAAAVQIYEALLVKGEVAEVYYNLGNSYFKAGNLGKAIVNYERALLLKPGNGDMRTNLEIARSRTIDRIDVIPDVFFVSWIKEIRNSMGVDAWGRWGIVFFILGIVSFYCFMYSGKTVFRKMGVLSIIPFLVLTILANVFASQQKSLFLNRNKAIVVSPSVTVRSTPSDSGTSLFVLHEGSKVIIHDDAMKGWKEIRLEDGKVGWISASDIEVI
ncbi:hypothetical protein EZS27_021006 [termite gut metagenome]|uniref:SH3b domain-containing protein n=1 Tax=termite gut metagenome TaxID=433724 RepID=A0A5J4R963_9ZZZZ